MEEQEQHEVAVEQLVEQVEPFYLATLVLIQMMVVVVVVLVELKMPMHWVLAVELLVLLVLYEEVQGQQTPTDVEVPDVTIQGAPATVYVNRQYLLKAIGFGLRQIEVQETLRPLRFSDGGSRQMIVMPVRVDANPPAPINRNTTPVPVPPIIPAAASTKAAPDQPETTNPNPQPERITTTMQNEVQFNGDAIRPVEPADKGGAWTLFTRGSRRHWAKWLH